MEPRQGAQTLSLAVTAYVHFFHSCFLLWGHWCMHSQNRFRAEARKQAMKRKAEAEVEAETPPSDKKQKILAEVSQKHEAKIGKLESELLKATTLVPAGSPAGHETKCNSKLGAASLASAGGIPGLTLVPEFLSLSEHDQLLASIDKQPWSAALSRRVQQYGFAYDYKGLSKVLAPTTAIPAALTPLMTALVAKGHMPREPEQVIINEYLPGQGIAPHIDQTYHFGPAVCSVSLGSACVMEFKHKHTGETKSLILEPRSALVLIGAARYDWLHSIPKRQTDQVGTRKIQRTRRVSVTFRLMKNGAEVSKP